MTDLATAQRERAAARDRVTRTLGEIQDRVNPKTVARNAARDLTDAGTAIAATGVETARRNPGALAGVTALAGLFLARHRIVALFRRARWYGTDRD